jgi:iron(III) transport system permease protein
MLGMAVFASFASFWPYNLSPSLRHYTMGLVDAEVGVGFRQQPEDGRGHGGVRHRAGVLRRLPAGKDPGMDGLRGLVRLLAMLPMAVPGLVLGLGYIFFFNEPTTRSTVCTTRSRC